MSIQEITTNLMQGGQLSAEEALRLANDPDKERAAKRKGWNKAVKYAFGWARQDEDDE